MPSRMPDLHSSHISHNLDQQRPRHSQTKLCAASRHHPDLERSTCCPCPCPCVCLRESSRPNHRQQKTAKHRPAASGRRRTTGKQLWTDNTQSKQPAAAAQNINIKIKINQELYTNMYRYTIWNIMNYSLNSLLKRFLQIFCSHNIIRSTLDMRNIVKAANSPAQ